MTGYQYEPLPRIPGVKSIRLATIRPGTGDDDVLVDLHIESFAIHSPPSYEALSYVWGSTEAPQPIYIGSSDRATLGVTRSLKTALQHLRYPDRERVVWVDAVCINQSDDVEKGAEVATMGQLYACAEHVVVWLGPEADGSGMAMERLCYIGSQIEVDWGGIQRITSASNLEHVDLSIADPNSVLPMDMEQSAAVASLLNREWFDRLWVRQEILVAEEKAFVCCGPDEMPWPVFRKALRLLYSKQSVPENVEYLFLNRLKTIGGFIFQLRWTDVLSIRNKFDNALCSDPRDRIFGIRSLLWEDQKALCGQPDYTRTTVDVYSDFTRNYITRYPNGLTILNQCELSQDPPLWSGPSWVPDWSTKSSMHWGKNTFASSQISGCFEFPEPGILRVLGVSRTEVTDIQPVPKFYNHDWDEAIEFLRRVTQPDDMTVTYPAGGSRLRAIARTVLCGSISDFMYVWDGDFPSSEIAEAEVSRFVSGVEFEFSEEDYKIGSNAQRFLKRMDWGSGGNNFITGSGGYVGVAPPSTQVGDEVFVVVGCQQPLLLRKCPEGPDRYSVVGKCYVEGCARGEPLLGDLPEHIGLSLIEDTAMRGWPRNFRDMRSGELSREDPRLESLGVDLDEFRARLAEDPEAMLSVPPDVLRERIADLRYIDLT